MKSENGSGREEVCAQLWQHGPVRDSGDSQSSQNMADIMFKRFTKDIKVVIDSVMFNNDNYKLIKDIKKRC